MVTRLASDKYIYQRSGLIFTIDANRHRKKNGTLADREWSFELDYVFPPRAWEVDAAADLVIEDEDGRKKFFQVKMPVERVGGFTSRRTAYRASVHRALELQRNYEQWAETISAFTLNYDKVFEEATKEIREHYKDPFEWNVPTSTYWNRPTEKPAYDETKFEEITYRLIIEFLEKTSSKEKA